MCALCGVPTQVAEPTPTPPKIPARARFAAFKNPDCRTYIVGASLSMGGDSIEHVISYWVLFQQFHSPALAGFAVISHWVPSLFGVYFGALADCYDCRKIIQAAHVLFMSGLRAGSGLSIGLVGGLIGIHWSLGLSAFTLMILVLGLIQYTARAAAAQMR